ncbi:McrB family protein [Bacteroides thetaiotaomicron]|uniref:McrB family protein n=1 Tax=Bacteroides thetaiotaomicron TaxID=818 RepID=UPI001F2DC047|nr:ATPase [Bacteroides thetaiotaomicron]MCE8951132.1 ATPase [Bacteroides thetaiotaomicron]MCE8970627.1 ATPase [Bacteroides thetaiotaomicron]
MKFISVKSVVEAYKGFQDCMTNKSWGYLALLKGCKSSICPSVPYEVNLDEVSSFLENIFNLSQAKKRYSSGRVLYVVFSNKWDKYFNDQGRHTPNIYDVAIWAYRRNSFEDNMTKEEILQKFAEEFNIPLNIISNSFNTHSKEIEFTDSLYSETVLKAELNAIGVDVSKENIDAKKGSVVAAPGEISRGPFVQTLYAGLEITDYVIILQSDYLSLYGNAIKSINSIDHTSQNKYSNYRSYITAIKTKPFLLLAGISGTGKSRIVRELARACWDEDSTEYKAQKPKNFEMIQVKPNWHDSTELMGYVSRVSGEPIFIAGDFLKFIAKAWENLDVPHFLCLDEMNLAPVEQYFAEYLSVVESRKVNEGGSIKTDPILKPDFAEEKDSHTGYCKPSEWYEKLISELLVDCPDNSKYALYSLFVNEGISLPQNLIVVGTVNMDETTFSFSRKVLDRAMTIEMNEVDLYAGLDSKYERIGKLNSDMLIGTAVEGVDVYADNEDVCNKVLTYLQAVNDVLNGTPFKVAYRTRNEFLLYVVNNLPYNMDKNGNEFSEDEVIATALDEITSMKILSRIEGDDTKVKHSLLERLITTIETLLLALTGEDKKIESVSIAKLKEMQERLSSGYTSFWS